MSGGNITGLRKSGYGPVDERLRRQKKQESIYHSPRLIPPMEPNRDGNTSNALYLVNAMFIGVNSIDTFT